MLSARTRTRYFILTRAIYFVFILIVVFVSFLQPQFISPENLQSLSRQAAILIVLAVGITIPLIAGEIDLSSASVAALSAMAAAWASYLGQQNMWVSASLGISVGILFGLFNGLITWKLKIPAFLVTLGSLSVARGMCWLWRQGRSIPITDSAFTNFWGTGDIQGVPVLFLWTTLILIVGGITLHRTVFGIHVFATGGGGEIAATFSGVDTSMVKFKALLFSGTLAGFAGVLLAGRLTAGAPTALTGVELDAITAPILGGASLLGGRGSVFSVLIGAAILVAVANAVVMLGFAAGMQILVRGVLVILAVLLSWQELK
jgi:ribose transport system permease protein